MHAYALSAVNSHHVRSHAAIRSSQVDFRDPSRHSAVTDDDDFWLRVDASLVRRRRRAAAARYGVAPSGNDSDDESDDDELDVSSLLSETHYFLGCAGAIEDAADEDTSVRQGRSSHQQQTGCNKENVRGAARSYAMPPLPPSSSSALKTPLVHDTFRLVAIRATVPSTDYYGDDSATREYTIETNANVLHLARWRFALDSRPSLSRQVTQVAASNGGDDDASASRLLLNCASVYLSLNHLVLESDPARLHRGVLRDVSTTTAAAKRASSDSVGRHLSSSSNGIAQLLRRHGKSVASWQVRLLYRAKQREEQPTATDTVDHVPSSTSSPHRSATELLAASPAEWLKQKQETLAHTDAVIRRKRSLARTAKRAYERVAAQSNRKVAEIEQQKARHQVEYFQSRYHTIFEAEAASEEGGSRRGPVDEQPARTLLPRIG